MRAHDARTWGGRDTGFSIPDRADLSQLWIGLGTSEGSGWSVRAGRQALSFGDERLIGSDAEWNNVEQSFDAVHVEVRSSSAGVTAFWGAPVELLPRSVNRPKRGDGLGGVFATWTGGQTLWSSYCLTSRKEVVDSRRTCGVHVRGSLRNAFTYNTEFSLQRGTVAGAAVRASAVHIELWRRLSPAIELGGEYNRASGNRRGSSHLGGFDDLYAAAYSKYGLPDPFAATNLQSLEAGTVWKPGKNVEVLGGYRSYWRSSRSDDLYPVNGEVLAAGPMQRLHAADQALACVNRSFRSKWRLSFGVGAFCRRHLPRTSGSPSRALAYVAVGRDY